MPPAHSKYLAIRDACHDIQSQDLSGSAVYSSAGFIDKVILAELRKAPADRVIQSTHFQKIA